MNDLLKSRLRGIQATLMAAHSSGSGLPNETIGDERQLLVGQFLGQVLSPIFRFGPGVIVDQKGAATGALDLVMELPFAPSFPFPGGSQRLYLSEGVGAVLEVKSHLGKQLEQALSTTRAVKSLVRNIQQSSGLLLESSPEPLVKPGSDVPVYIVAYRGNGTVDTLKKTFDEIPTTDRPTGILVVESGAFVGGLGRAEGPEGLFVFAAELAATANSLLQIASPNLPAYR